MEAWSNQGPKGLLKNAIGWPCCIKTAPMAVPKAAITMMNGALKSGRAKTRLESWPV